MGESKQRKEATKGKKEKDIHPNSRRAGQLSKVIARHEKLQKRKNERDLKVDGLLEKITWFQDELDMEKDKYTLAEVSDLIARYISRFQPRIDEIDAENVQNKKLGRRGLVHESEKNGILMIRDREMELFRTNHFEAPDLTNAKNMKIFKEWGGEAKDMQSIKLRKFKQILEDERTEDNEESNMDMNSEQQNGLAEDEEKLPVDGMEE